MLHNKWENPKNNHLEEIEKKNKSILHNEWEKHIKNNTMAGTGRRGHLLQRKK
jgi:hypothetical protein